MPVRALSIACAVALGWACTQQIVWRERAPRGDPGTDGVVVARVDVPAGAELHSDDVELVLATNGASPYRFHAVDDVVGRVAADPLFSGEPVDARRLANPDLTSNVHVPPDHLALVVGGPEGLQPVGSWVDVWAAWRGGACAMAQDLPVRTGWLATSSKRST